jgi:hypothetical protein
VQVNGNIFGAIFPEQPIDCFCDFLLRHFRRQFIHRPVIGVLDLERVQEIAEHFLVRAEQPCLQHVACERVADLPTERRLHPRGTFGRRFPLDENAAQIPLVREPLDRCFVNRLLFRLQKSENLGCQSRRHPLKNFVRSHQSPETMPVSAASSTGRHPWALKAARREVVC